MPNRVQSRRKKSVVQSEQHVKATPTNRKSIAKQLRSTNRESIEAGMTVAVQPQSVHAVEESFRVPESDDSLDSCV